MTDALLAVQELTKRYADETVLDGVSFEMAQGNTNVIIGPSGSGKSTLLRCINRLTDIDSGAIYLAGDDTTAPDYDLDALRRNIGMVFQNINLFAHLTALENVTLGLKRVQGMAADAAQQKAREQLDQVGLAGKADSYPAELSGGQQQRVGIARALALDPKLMLFDEPTSSLDPELTGEVIEVMEELADEGMTMLVVTHEMSFAQSAANEVMFLEDADFVERGPPQQLFDHPEQNRTAEFLERIQTGEADNGVALDQEGRG